MKNILLVKYPGGYVEVTTTHTGRRREGSLSVDVTTIGEAVRIADSLLLQLREPQLEITATVESRGGDEPYTNFQLGDELTVPNIDGVPIAARVVGLTVQVDAEGNPIFRPELDIGHEV